MLLDWKGLGREADEAFGAAWGPERARGSAKTGPHTRSAPASTPAPEFPEPIHTAPAYPGETPRAPQSAWETVASRHPRRDGHRLRCRASQSPRPCAMDAPGTGH